MIETRTPIALHDWTLRAGASIGVPIAASYATYVYVFEGAAEIAGTSLREGRLAVLGEGANSCQDPAGNVALAR